MNTMNKIANMRHWSERMSPAFGMPSRNAMPPMPPPHQKIAHQGAPTIPPQATDSFIYYTFNVPFASDLTGPDTEDILHATADAVLRWTHPEEAPDDVPVYELPVHTENLNKLRQTCKDITSDPQHPIEAHVLSSTPQHVKGQVTTVCLSGPSNMVYQTRERILNETPLSLVSTDLDMLHTHTHTHISAWSWSWSWSPLTGISAAQRSTLMGRWSPTSTLDL